MIYAIVVGLGIATVWGMVEDSQVWDWAKLLGYLLLMAGVFFLCYYLFRS